MSVDSSDRRRVTATSLGLPCMYAGNKSAACLRQTHKVATRQDSPQRLLHTFLLTLRKLPQAAETFTTSTPLIVCLRETRPPSAAGVEPHLRKLREDALHRRGGRLLREGAQIRAHEAGRSAGHRCKVQIPRQPQLSRQHLQQHAVRSFMQPAARQLPHTLPSRMRLSLYCTCATARLIVTACLLL